MQTPTIPGNETAAESARPLVVALLGAGAISRVHASAWKELGAEVLVYSAAGAQELAEQYGLEVVDTLQEALRRADCVDIVTPTGTHRALARAAIDAGKNIVCEKPLTLSARESREVYDAAREAGVHIYPAHVVRFTAPYVAAHRAVVAGRIGKVAVARFFRGGSSPAVGTWFQDEAASGGIIMDLMIHDLDQARWTCGEVETVYAVQSPPTLDNVVPSFVSAHVTLTHVGGAISHIRATWGAVGTPFTTGFSIAGDAGVLHYDSTDSTGLTTSLHGAESSGLVVPTSALRESPYLTELREFAEAFTGGPEPRVNAEDGAVAVYLAQAAYQSIITGRVVDMNEFDHAQAAAA
ncbi:myo-inositol 2-dehydrogenase/D-chiro-inositol 1-dehydrogenase [Mycetocola sp. CAN_C7]|uniref:Gfo/Idh/MocA family protein n=1 Tax=Mycetocola sp. CAN_C7 TaxID=2787724 RepID=UPI0018C908A9